MAHPKHQLAKSGPYDDFLALLLIFLLDFYSCHLLLSDSVNVIHSGALCRSKMRKTFLYCMLIATNYLRWGELHPLLKKYLNT